MSSESTLHRRVDAQGRVTYGYLEDCALCGALQPSAHVVVWDQPRSGRHAGRICASHTLAEIVLDPKARFMVGVYSAGPKGDEALAAAERAAWQREQAS